MENTEESRGLRFNGKVAVVSGGCNGIGRGCVDVLVENGGKVAVLDVDDATGSTLKPEGPGEVFYIKCDAVNEQEVKKAMEAIFERFGRIDLLVNNVGRHPGQQNLEDISVDDFRDLMNINLVSHFIHYKYALPYIRKVQGSVVNIASFSGSFGQGKCPVYCATKAAITGMAKAMAIDEAQNGVRVNAIAPGAINTAILKRWMESAPKEEADALIQWNKMRRVGEPREIGLACVYLATDATYTTGTELLCTGGCEIGYGLKQ